MHPSSVNNLLFIVIFSLLAAVGAAFADEAPLYTYPVEAKSKLGRSIRTPQTINVEQITTNSRNVSFVAGKVLIVYWSSLCPRKGECDFSLIDSSINYWRERGKKIILDVATIGYPLQTDEGRQSATPDWVLNGVRTYAIDTRILATEAREGRQDMPDFRDPAFVDAVADLVAHLARYDGNPNIAQIRIGTGLMGEDNPLMGPLSAPVNGLTEQDWLEYTTKIAALYFAKFKNTQLEFDIGRLSWMSARGGDSDRAQVGLFLDVLLSKHVLLAFDGLSIDCANKILNPDPRNGVSVSLHYLESYKKRGGEIGLEAIGPAYSPGMSDTAALAFVVRAIKPDRLVLFADIDSEKGAKLTKALNYH